MNRPDGGAARESAFQRALAMLRQRNFSPPWSEVTPTLFVGDLRSLVEPPPSVTHTVSLVGDDMAVAQRSERHLVLALADDAAEERLLDCVERAVAWLPREGAVVLVHCTEGRSRSPALAAGLLMRRDGLSVGDALALVARRRPRVAVEPRFVRDLESMRVP